MAVRRRAMGDGSVYYDAARGRWVAQVWLSPAPGETRRRKRRAVARTKTEAHQRLRVLLVEAGVPVPVGAALTLGEWMEVWLTSVLPDRRVSEKTAQGYEGSARHLASLAPRRLDQLRVEHVEALLRRLAEQGMARDTCRLVRATLSVALADAERRGLVSGNVARSARLPQKAKRRSERKALTPDEAKALEAAIAGEPDEALWLSMLLLGLRPGEATGLTWADVDTEAGVLHVAGARKWTPTGYVLGPPKTKRAVRALRMPPKLVEAFAKLPRGAPEALVFPNTAGGLRDPASDRQRLARLCRRAVLPVVTPYELRHTAASLLSDAGVPIEVVADLLGHSTTQMLEQVYRHRVRKVVDPGLW